LPPFWRTVTLFNPLVYLISGFRWSFFDIADVHVGAWRSPSASSCCAWRSCPEFFKTGYRLKN
jgi:ABC-2 type transport system permease protein